MYDLKMSFLPLSWQRSLSYRNQSIDLLSKSLDWFLYDKDLRHERVSWLIMIDKCFRNYFRFFSFWFPRLPIRFTFCFKGETKLYKWFYFVVCLWKLNISFSLIFSIHIFVIETQSLVIKVQERQFYKK